MAGDTAGDCVPCEERIHFEREALMRIRRGLLGALAGVDQLLRGITQGEPQSLVRAVPEPGTGAEARANPESP